MLSVNQKESMAQAGGKKSFKSFKSVKTKFIPPTHPAYVVATSFAAPHIQSLKEAFEQNNIAFGMQTGKKKLCRAPDAKMDKIFLVVDNSAGPVPLIGEFLTLKYNRVDYPVGCSTAEVIKKFDSYIGLGKYEETIKEGQYNHEEGYQLEAMRERALRGQNGPQLVGQGGKGQGAELDLEALRQKLQKLARSKSDDKKSKNIKLRSVEKYSKNQKISQSINIEKRVLFILMNDQQSEHYLRYARRMSRGVNKRIMIIHMLAEYFQKSYAYQEGQNCLLLGEYAAKNQLFRYRNLHDVFLYGQDMGQCSRLVGGNINHALVDEKEMCALLKAKGFDPDEQKQYIIPERVERRLAEDEKNRKIQNMKSVSVTPSKLAGAGKISASPERKKNLFEKLAGFVKGGSPPRNPPVSRKSSDSDKNSEDLISLKRMLKGKKSPQSSQNENLMLKNDPGPAKLSLTPGSDQKRGLGIQLKGSGSLGIDSQTSSNKSRRKKKIKTGKVKKSAKKIPMQHPKTLQRVGIEIARSGSDSKKSIESSSSSGKAMVKLRSQTVKPIQQESFGLAIAMPPPPAISVSGPPVSQHPPATAALSVTSPHSARVTFHPKTKHKDSDLSIRNEEGQYYSVGAGGKVEGNANVKSSLGLEAQFSNNLSTSREQEDEQMQFFKQNSPEVEIEASNSQNNMLAAEQLHFYANGREEQSEDEQGQFHGIGKTAESEMDEQYTGRAPLKLASEGIQFESEVYQPRRRSINVENPLQVAMLSSFGPRQVQIRSEKEKEKNYKSLRRTERLKAQRQYLLYAVADVKSGKSLDPELKRILFKQPTKKEYQMMAVGANLSKSEIQEGLIHFNHRLHAEEKSKQKTYIGSFELSNIRANIKSPEPDASKEFTIGAAAQVDSSDDDQKYVEYSKKTKANEGILGVQHKGDAEDLHPIQDKPISLSPGQAYRTHVGKKNTLKLLIGAPAEENMSGSKLQQSDANIPLIETDRDQSDATLKLKAQTPTSKAPIKGKQNQPQPGRPLAVAMSLEGPKSRNFEDEPNEDLEVTPNFKGQEDQTERNKTWKKVLKKENAAVEEQINEELSKKENGKLKIGGSIEPKNQSPGDKNQAKNKYQIGLELPRYQKDIEPSSNPHERRQDSTGSRSTGILAHQPQSPSPQTSMNKFPPMIGLQREEPPSLDIPSDNMPFNRPISHSYGHPSISRTTPPTNYPLHSYLPLNFNHELILNEDNYDRLVDNGVVIWRPKASNPCYVREAISVKPQHQSNLSTAGPMSHYPSIGAPPILNSSLHDPLPQFSAKGGVQVQPYSKIQSHLIAPSQMYYPSSKTNRQPSMEASTLPNETGSAFKRDNPHLYQVQPGHSGRPNPQTAPHTQYPLRQPSQHKLHSSTRQGNHGRNPGRQQRGPILRKPRPQRIHKQLYIDQDDPIKVRSNSHEPRLGLRPKKSYKNKKMPRIAPMETDFEGDSSQISSSDYDDPRFMKTYQPSRPINQINEQYYPQPKSHLPHDPSKANKCTLNIRNEGLHVRLNNDPNAVPRDRYLRNRRYLSLDEVLNTPRKLNMLPKLKANNKNDNKFSILFLVRDSYVAGVTKAIEPYCGSLDSLQTYTTTDKIKSIIKRAHEVFDFMVIVGPKDDKSEILPLLETNQDWIKYLQSDNSACESPEELEKSQLREFGRLLQEIKDNYERRRSPQQLSKDIANIYYKDFNKSVLLLAKQLAKAFPKADSRKYFGVNDLPSMMPTDQITIIILDEVGFDDSRRYIELQQRCGARLLKVCVPKANESIKICQSQSSADNMLWFTSEESKDHGYLVKKVLKLAENL